jgi:hypothetical protein
MHVPHPVAAKSGKTVMQRPAGTNANIKNNRNSKTRKPAVCFDNPPKKKEDRDESEV